MTQQASRPAVCTVAPAAVQQATQEARGTESRQWSQQQEESMVKITKPNPNTKPTTEKGKAPAATPAHVDPNPTMAPGKPQAVEQAPATPAAPPTTPAATEPGAPATDQAAQPGRRKRTRAKRTFVQKRVVSLISIGKRLDKAVRLVKPMHEETHANLGEKLETAKALVLQVRDLVAKLPEDWKPAQPERAKKTAEVFLTGGSKVVVREAYSDRYGEAAAGVLEFVANRRGMVEVKGPKGVVFIPRGHLIPAVSTVAAPKEAASS